MHLPGVPFLACSSAPPPERWQCFVVLLEHPAQGSPVTPPLGLELDLAARAWAHWHALALSGAPTSANQRTARVLETCAPERSSRRTRGALAAAVADWERWLAHACANLLSRARNEPPTEVVALPSPRALLERSPAQARLLLAALSRLGLSWGGSAPDAHDVSAIALVRIPPALVGLTTQLRVGTNSYFSHPAAPPGEWVGSLRTLPAALSVPERLTELLGLADQLLQEGLPATQVWPLAQSCLLDARAAAPPEGLSSWPETAFPGRSDALTPRTGGTP